MAEGSTAFSSLARGLAAGIKAFSEFLVGMIAGAAKEAEQILEARWPEPLDVKWQTSGPVKIIEMRSIQEAEPQQQQGTVARHSHAKRSGSYPTFVDEPRKGARPVARAPVRRLADRLVMLINDPRASKSGVCPVCEALEGMTFTEEEFKQLVPLHPHCKCKWIPVVNEGAKAGRKPEIDMEDAADVVMERVTAKVPEAWERFLKEWRRGV